MTFKWFETADVEAFADRMAAELVARFPPTEFSHAARKSPARMRKARAAILHDLEVFAGQTSLNIYRKARLGNRFKWALREAGYPEDFADELTHEIVSLVSAGSGKSQKP